MRTELAAAADAAIAREPRRQTAGDDAPDAWLRALERTQWAAWLDHGLLPAPQGGPAPQPHAFTAAGERPLFALPRMPAAPRTLGPKAGGPVAAAERAALPEAPDRMPVPATRQDVAAAAPQSGAPLPARPTAVGTQPASSAHGDSTRGETGAAAFLPALAAAVADAAPVAAAVTVAGAMAAVPAPADAATTMQAALPAPAPTGTTPTQAGAPARIAALWPPATVPWRDSAGDDHEPAAATASAAPPAADDTPPLRVHAQWQADGVRVWIGADGAVAADAVMLAHLVARLRQLCGAQGMPLLAVVCNGRPYRDDTAAAARSRPTPFDPPATEQEKP